MTDAQSLELARLKAELVVTLNYHQKKRLERKIDALEKQEVEWVSISDGLPEENQYCLWCTVPVVEPPWVGSMCEDAFCEDYYTHWMPLPNSFFPPNG